MGVVALIKEYVNEHSWQVNTPKKVARSQSELIEREELLKPGEKVDSHSSVIRDIRFWRPGPVEGNVPLE